MILPIINCPPTNTAPELPADTKASAFPSFTRFSATTMEESFFLRIAITGASSQEISSLASITSTRSDGIWYLNNSASIASFFPTKKTFILFRSKIASTAPFTISPGALSPPIASTATFIISSISNFLHFYSSNTKTKKTISYT